MFRWKKKVSSIDFPKTWPRMNAIGAEWKVQQLFFFYSGFNGSLNIHENISLFSFLSCCVSLIKSYACELSIQRIWESSLWRPLNINGEYLSSIFLTYDATTRQQNIYIYAEYAPLALYLCDFEIIKHESVYLSKSQNP